MLHFVRDYDLTSLCFIGVVFAPLSPDKSSLTWLSVAWNEIVSNILRYLLTQFQIFSQKLFSETPHNILNYSRLQNKHRGMLINFWTFFQGLHSLLERVMHIFFQNIRYSMVWGMPIWRATLNIFAKSSVGYVYSRGFVYSRV